MKKIIITFSLLVFSFLLNTTNAASIPALGLSTTSQYAGKVVFSGSVYVNTDAFVANTGADMTISGNFWMKELSSTSDPTLGWATFDHGVSSANVILKNNLNNTFTFSGYAWSKAAGWIYFSPTNLISGDDRSKVVYDRGANDGKGEITGCARSQNLGWVCFDGITLDTTPPHIFSDTNLSMVKSANNIQTITLNETSTGKIQNWNSTATTNFTTNASFQFTHDMRNAGLTSRDYDIEATDIYGNTSTGKITIVANIPQINNVNFTGTLDQDKIADGYDKHIIDIKLRDAYGNPVVPVTGIKNVVVNIGFSGNLDLDQINNYDFGDAVTFDGGNDFSDLVYQFGNSFDNGSTTDGNYYVEFTSLAPSKYGYSYTSSGNDIQVNNLDIAITALNGNSGVGEGPINNIHTSFYSTPYKFTPAIKIDGVSNNTDWVIHRDYETEFTITGSTNKTTGSSDLTNIHITHLFDTMSGSTYYTNDQISYQNLTGSISQTTCTGSNTSTGYYSSDPDCDRSSLRPFSSNTIKSYDTVTSPTSSISSIISAIPRLVSAGLESFDTKYSSVISYKIGINDIKYPSYTTTTSTINNSQIKISGIVNDNNNNFSVVADSSINYIGNVLKSDVYTLIHKNVSIYQKAGTGSSDTLYMTGNYTLTTWPTGIETIIVDEGDVIISSDITKNPGIVKTIIALKKSDGTMGNIWIKDGVQFVGATLIADRSVISGDLTTYYTDSNSAIRQLFIKGSVISYNTIGGSSRTPVICPFYLTTICDLQTAKRYDFNHFRSYINGFSGNPVPGLNTSITGYANAPMIIEYDSDTQINPPEIIKK